MDAQTLTIRYWHPPQELNASHVHWSTVRRHRKQTKQLVLLAARTAGWSYVEGRVRLDVVLVYPRRYHSDDDNTTARGKAICDALKGEFFRDDSTDWLDLNVTTAVEKHTKATRITQAPAAEEGSARRQEDGS